MRFGKKEDIVAGIDWNQTILLDGAMGTQIQKHGLTIGDRPERLNVTEPNAIIAIHRSYLEAGSQIIYTNTFGASRTKLEGTGLTPQTVIPAAVRNARKAVAESRKEALVALDIGPLGELLEPTGQLSFEDAVSAFAEQVQIGVEAGCDLIVIETLTDLYEAKAALLAVKENTDIPVFLTMSFEENLRSFTGTTLESLVALAEGLGATAFGLNCSLGPVELLPHVEKLVTMTELPLIIKANAGLPDPATGKYGIGPEEFAEAMHRLFALGVNIVGGCCGTDPSYISALRKAVENEQTGKKRKTIPPYLCSATVTVPMDRARVIGERINPTGKKRFIQAIKENDEAYILAQAVEQVEAGADLLDINVGVAGIDEAAAMKKTVKAVQSVADVPLVLDSGNSDALEAGLRVVNGRPLVNSVNGKKEVLDAILPLVKKYGAAVVGLTLDEKGIPQSVEERVQIAKRIRDVALSYGIPKERVYIDCLTLTVSAQLEGAWQTLEAVRRVKEELGLKTLLGVSNISFGLPARPILNRNFLAAALQAGLDLAILNPNDDGMMDAVYSHHLFANQDEGAARYIARFQGKDIEEKRSAAKDINKIEEEKPKDLSAELILAVHKGLKQECAAITKELLNTKDAMLIIDTVLIPALDQVGKQYETGEIFLPQLIRSADASQRAFEVIKTRLAEEEKSGVNKGTIVIATVEGDIHDIGKNIVKVILENYGFRVVDLGRDVPPATVCKAVEEESAMMVGLSALMTTTLISMEKTIRLLREQFPSIHVMVGGAVVTEDYARSIGADSYGKDAKASADIARAYFSKNRGRDK